MNIPEIKSYEDQAIDVVVTVLNGARFGLGERLNLVQLSQSRELFAGKHKASLGKLRRPFAVTVERFLARNIERVWQLSPTLMYHIKYVGTTQDEITQFYYFEVIFSQPRANYPIPQVTASVFFRLSEKHIEPIESRGVPMMHYRVEGEYTSHDIRYVLLTLDQILAVMQKKILLFKRIENLRIF